MKVFFRLSIFIFGILFSESLFAQQNKDLPIKTIPVKPKNSALKDTASQRDTLTKRKTLKEKQVDVADLSQPLAIRLYPGLPW